MGIRKNEESNHRNMSVELPKVGAKNEKVKNGANFTVRWDRILSRWMTHAIMWWIMQMGIWKNVG